VDPSDVTWSEELTSDKAGNIDVDKLNEVVRALQKAWDADEADRVWPDGKKKAKKSELHTACWHLQRYQEYGVKKYEKARPQQPGMGRLPLRTDWPNDLKRYNVSVDHEDSCTINNVMFVTVNGDRYLARRRRDAADKVWWCHPCPRCSPDGKDVFVEKDGAGCDSYNHVPGKHEFADEMSRLLMVEASGGLRKSDGEVPTPKESAFYAGCFTAAMMGTTLSNRATGKSIVAQRCEAYSWWGQAHYSILHRKYKERGHEEEFLMSWKLCSRGHGVLREEAPPSPATTPPPSDALKDGSVVACLACGECTNLTSGMDDPINTVHTLETRVAYELHGGASTVSALAAVVITINCKMNKATMAMKVKQVDRIHRLQLSGVELVPFPGGSVMMRTLSGAAHGVTGGGAPDAAGVAKAATRKSYFNQTRGAAGHKRAIKKAGHNVDGARPVRMTPAEVQRARDDGKTVKSALTAYQTVIVPGNRLSKPRRQPTYDTGRKLHPTNDTGRTLHPTYDTGRTLHPTYDTGRKLHPTNDTGRKLHPTYDTGRKLHTTKATGRKRSLTEATGRKPKRRRVEHTKATAEQGRAAIALAATSDAEKWVKAVHAAVRDKEAARPEPTIEYSNAHPNGKPARIRPYTHKHLSQKEMSEPLKQLPAVVLLASALLDDDLRALLEAHTSAEEDESLAKLAPSDAKKLFTACFCALSHGQHWRPS